MLPKQQRTALCTAHEWGPGTELDVLTAILRIGPVSQVVLNQLPLSGLYRLLATSTQLAAATRPCLSQRTGVHAVDVASGEHAAALQQLVHSASPGQTVDVLPALYILKGPLQLRTPVHIRSRQADGDSLASHLLLHREGACVEVRAPSVRLSGLLLDSTHASLRVHATGTGVEVDDCQLHGTVVIKRRGEVTLRKCTINKPVLAYAHTNGGWKIHHAVSVEGAVVMQDCKVANAGARGIHTSGQRASARLIKTTVLNSGRHGVFADSGARVLLEPGCIVTGCRGVGCCASGKRSVLEIVPPRMANDVEDPLEPNTDETTAAAAVIVESNAGGAFWDSHGGVIRGVERNLID